MLAFLPIKLVPDSFFLCLATHGGIMSEQLTPEEHQQRLAAKDKLANAATMIIVDDKFLRAYLKKIFVEIIGIENTLEFQSTEQAKHYLNQTPGNNIAFIISCVDFIDGANGIDFIGYIRSTYRITTPVVLVGDDPKLKIEYAFLVKHFAGYIGASFTPTKFIRMLLEVFEVRDRRREQRELLEASKQNRPFNRLFEGGVKSK